MSHKSERKRTKSQLLQKSVSTLLNHQQTVAVFKKIPQRRVQNKHRLSTPIPQAAGIYPWKNSRPARGLHRPHINAAIYDINAVRATLMTLQIGFRQKSSS